MVLTSEIDYSSGSAFISLDIIIQGDYHSCFSAVIKGDQILLFIQEEQFVNDT